MKKLLFALPLLALFALGIPAASVQAAGLGAPGMQPAVKSDVVKVRRRGFRRFRRRGLTIRIYPRYRSYRRYRHVRSCGWLRRRARRSGRSYWWRRYNRCRWG